MYATPTGLDSNGQTVSLATSLGVSHPIYVKAQVETPDGTVLTNQLSLVGGDVTVDRSAAVRRVCRCAISPTMRDANTGILSTLIPKTSSDFMAPYGNLLRLFYGIGLPGVADPFYWPLGLFRLSGADIDDDGTPDLVVNGSDLSRTISRNKLTVPWFVGSGVNWGDAIIALASDRYPYLQARAHAVTATTAAALVIDPEQDPWEVITQWATAVGCSVYFDVDGYLTITPEPDPSTDPVSWTYQDSGDGKNALLISSGRSLSDDPGYNGVVLTSESVTITTPLRSEAWDLNPSSPTYSLGAYGMVPKFVSNPYVATQAQADAAAQAELLRIIGGTERVTVGVVPNPAHEAGDVIQVIRPNSYVNQTTVLESFVIPFAASDRMSLTFRERRTTS